jgi:hypothetical protein
MAVDTRLSIGGDSDVELSTLTLRSPEGWATSTFQLVPGPLIDIKTGRVVVQHCVLEHAGQKCALSVREAACGVLVKNSFNATVEINGMGSLEGNDISNCSGIGLSVTGGQKDPASGETMLTTVSGNKITSCGGYGAWFRRRANVAFLNNTVKHCAADAVCAEDVGTTVTASLNNMW